MKALIKVGYACNNHCLFCHTARRRGVVGSSAAVLDKIALAATLACDTVVFSGGEPTLRPELLHWARRAHALGLAVGLVTNGRALAYDRRVERLVALGLRYAHVSLHGGTAAVHDALVEAEGFAQAVQGIEHLVRQGVDVTLNCVLVRQNLEALAPLVELAGRLRPARLKLSFAEPKGAALERFADIVPRVTDAARAALAAVRHAAVVAQGLRIELEGFPLCTIAPFAELASGLRGHEFAWMSEVDESAFAPIDDDNKVHLAVCDECVERGRCPGLFGEYVARCGGGELRAHTGLRSNSLHFVREATLAPVAGSACPVPAPVLARSDAARGLFVQEAEGLLAHYRTRTSDFATDELLELKRLEQLYLDEVEPSLAEGRAAPDDFAHDLSRLRLAACCRCCTQQAHCARCFVRVAGDAFAEDELALSRVLETLRGIVLDVGCGDGRYGELWQRRVQAGEVVYRGVEPDGVRAAALRAKWPWAEVTTSAAEDLLLAPASLDAALLLRSYNHLRTPRAVADALCRALRPLGRLVVVDNLPLALLRTLAQAKRGEGGDAVFEHYRNHGAKQAETLLAGLPLRLVSRRDVEVGTGNQWLLCYERTA